MPYLVCKIHGGVLAPHGCRHVAESIRARHPPGHTTLIDLDGWFFKALVCDVCLSALNDHGLQTYLARKESFDDYPPEHEIEPLIQVFDWCPMCARCFEELSHETSNQA